MSVLSRRDLFNYSATETKPTIGIPAHSVCIETDTGDSYWCDGDSWNKTGTAGADHVTDTTYGDYPDRDYVDINEALPASSTATLYESTDISAYDSLALDLSTITAGDNVKAYPSYNGTTYSATPLAWRNLTTDAVIAGTTGITAAAIFALVMAAGGMKVRKVKFTYTAVTTGTVAFTGGLW